MAGFALVFFCGIMAASFILPGRYIILGSFLLSSVIIFINRSDRKRRKAAVLLTILLAGMLDYSLALGVTGKLSAFEGKAAVYELLITDTPLVKGKYLQYPATCIFIACEGKHYNFKEKVFLRLGEKTGFQFGDIVSVEGESAAVNSKRNPGDFDYRLYYKSKGISNVITGNTAKLLKSDGAGIMATALHFSKVKVRNIIETALPKEEAAMLVGIITGDKTDIDEDTRAVYTKTGLSHILSVSGLHVGFLMLLLTYMLMPFKLPHKLQGMIILSIITYYILLIGAPLPSVRSLLMLSVLMLGKAIGREYNLLSSVAFAGMAILVVKPLAIHDPGFIISFGAMLSIALLYPSIFNVLQFIPSAIRSTAALSLSVFLGLTPIIAHYFNYISLISIVVNLLAVPLSMLITISGFVGVLTGIFSKALSIYVFSVDYYLISLLTYITRKAAALTFSGFYIPSLPIYFHILYYALIGFGISYSRITIIKLYSRRIMVSWLLALIAALFIYNLPSKDLEMVFFDVGQGDSCCIITPGNKVVLVDGGGSSRNGDYYYNIGERITLPALLHQGIWRLDTIVVSHMHDDHMEGLLKVMEVYPVKNLIIPKVSAPQENISPSAASMLDFCNIKGIKVHRLGKGDILKLEKGVVMEFFLPVKEAKSDENENSLVGRLVYGNFSAMLSGDIGMESEKALAGRNIEAAVLKVPHHGSKWSSSEEFLMGVRPRVSIISVGRNNFGHPSEAAIKRLERTGQVLRTDINGAVTVKTDGRNMKVRSMKY